MRVNSLAALAWTCQGTLKLKLYPHIPPSIEIRRTNYERLALSVGLYVTYIICNCIMVTIPLGWLVISTLNLLKTFRYPPTTFVEKQPVSLDNIFLGFLTYFFTCKCSNVEWFVNCCRCCYSTQQIAAKPSDSCATWTNSVATAARFTTSLTASW